MTEKILAAHAGRSVTTPGEYLWCKVDAAGGIPHDMLDRLGVTKLHAPDRTYVVEDHLAPPPTIERANVMVKRREAVNRFGVRNFFEYGRQGILHQVFAENGMFAPGELVAMRDSHSPSAGVFNACVTSANEDSILSHIFGEVWFRVPHAIKLELTGSWPQSGYVTGKDLVLELIRLHGTDKALYKTIEVVGPGVATMPLSDRWAVANMSVEMGAKFCVFECDDVVREYLAGRVHREFTPVVADDDAYYEETIKFDLSRVEPLVACPHDPGNVIPVSELHAQRIAVNQAFIGSCTNGRLDDYRAAANVMAGHSVHPSVRLLCSPASQEVWLDVLKAGIWETLADAGANIEHSSCGPCFGGHMGVLGDHEVCISSTNRNFQGRQGSPLARVYLASPSVVAASAVTGYITDPRQLALSSVEKDPVR